MKKKLRDIMRLNLEVTTIQSETKPYRYYAIICLHVALTEPEVKKGSLYFASMLLNA